ncbi:MAG: SRPBCC family protein [Solirubrobacterales bacterium]
MARYVTTVESPRTPEDAFDYMADFTKLTDWDPSAVESVALGEAPGPGARFAVRVGFAGRQVALTYETTAYERPRRLVLRAENSTTVSEDTVTVEPRGSGSAVTYDARLALKGPMRLAEPLLGLAFRRLGDRAAAGLRRELGAAD